VWQSIDFFLKGTEYLTRQVRRTEKWAKVARGKWLQMNARTDGRLISGS
jgi:hypothetical protein